MRREFIAIDTACRKCAAPMPEPKPMAGMLAGATFRTTAYRCACGHWNDLRSRKANRIVIGADPGFEVGGTRHGKAPETI